MGIIGKQFVRMGKSTESDNRLDYQSRDREIDSHFSGLSGETVNRGPISVRPHGWWDVKPKFTHL